MNFLYTKLYQLYCKGDYTQFTFEFNSQKEDHLLDDNKQLLGISAFFDIGNWDQAYMSIQALQQSVSPVIKSKAKLLKLKIDFLLGEKTIEKGEFIIRKIREEKKTFSNDCNFMCFADKTEYQINVILLTFGLKSADQKKENINYGKKIFLDYYKINKSESIVFFTCLLNDCISGPQSNIYLAENLFTEYSGLFSKYDEKIALVPLYEVHTKIMLILTCPTSDFIGQDIVVKLEKIIKQCAASGYCCAEELIRAKYGEHLLDLENISGLSILNDCIRGFLKYGHYKKAETYYRKCVSWMNKKGIFEHPVQEWVSSFNSSFYENPLQRDTDNLETIYTAFLNADYELGVKLCNEYLSISQSENNRVSLLCFLSNHAKKAGWSNSDIKQLINSEILRLEHLEWSILLAQLYEHMALAHVPVIDEYWEKAISQYKHTGYIENEIETILHYLSCKTELTLRKNLLSVSDPDTTELLNRVSAYFSSTIFIQGRKTLQAQYHQIKGYRLFNEDIQAAIDEFTKAANCFFEANSFNQYAINQHSIACSLINQARESGHSYYYNETLNILNPAIEILFNNHLTDFVWRLLFLQYVCYFELAFKTENKLYYLEKAEISLHKAFDTYSSIFKKMDSTPNVEKQLASITLNKDARQLLTQGFYYYYLNQDWRNCIIWLEKISSRSLNSVLASYLQPSRISHSLITQEHHIKKQLQKENNILNRRRLSTNLQKLYERMLKEPELIDYSLRKQQVIPQYAEFTEGIACEEKYAKNSIVFIYYYLWNNRIYVFGINTLSAAPWCETINISEKQLNEDIRIFRLQMKAFPLTKMLPSFCSDYGYLIAPLLKHTKPGDICCIIPQGILHDLPFHTLIYDNCPLIIRNPVFYNNSLLNWEYIRRNAKPETLMNQPEIMGDPQKNLTGAEKEAQNISNILNTSYITGHEITKEKFLQKLSQSTLLHFAGHGYFANENELFSSIILSGDEPLSTKEILEQAINTNLIVLSACETGRHMHHDGQEQIGLASSFLFAGASSVITSLWPVDDNSTELFFTTFYKKLKSGQPKVLALRETMLNLMDIPQMSSYLHWGAFTLKGYWK